MKFNLAYLLNTLTIVFITLKVIGLTTMSWFVAFLPTIIWLLLCLTVFLFTYRIIKSFAKLLKVISKSLEEANKITQDIKVDKNTDIEDLYKRIQEEIKISRKR